MDLVSLSLLLDKCAPADLERGISALIEACSGGNLRALREHARLSQDVLSSIAGISQPSLSLIESGTNRPTAQTAIRLWRACVGEGEGISPRVEQILSQQEKRRLKEQEEKGKRDLDAAVAKLKAMAAK